MLRSADKHNQNLWRMAALYREHPFVVEFWNPGLGFTVRRGFGTWADAMQRVAHYNRKYGRFDDFEKPRIKATGARLTAFQRAVKIDTALADQPLYVCSVCGRKSYERAWDWTTVCNLPQPDGSRCSGWMRPLRLTEAQRTELIRNLLCAWLNGWDPGANQDLIDEAERMVGPLDA